MSSRIASSWFGVVVDSPLGRRIGDLANRLSPAGQGYDQIWNLRVGSSREKTTPFDRFATDGAHVMRSRRIHRRVLI
jgi:hypothetical protein